MLPSTTIFSFTLRLRTSMIFILRAIKSLDLREGSIDSEAAEKTGSVGFRKRPQEMHRPCRNAVVIQRVGSKLRAHNEIKKLELNWPVCRSVRILPMDLGDLVKNGKSPEGLATLRSPG